MAQSRAELIAWVGSHIVPHEAAVRAWLRKVGQSPEEIEDIVQDAYVAIARLDSVAHIRSGRSYLFQTARSMILRRVRRERIVAIDRLTELDAAAIPDEDPGPERRVSSRRELERVRALIEALPERCREIFVLRRIQGVPQREIAERTGLAETVVEQQAARGLRLILKAIAGEDRAAEARIAQFEEAERGVERGQ